MKNLPIKKEIEGLLQKEKSGIWGIKDRNQYLKATSKLCHHPISIPISHYKDLKDAVADVERCAKVYKELIAIRLYHPKTEIVVYKTEEKSLALMVIMPELKLDYSETLEKLICERIKDIEKNLNLKEKLSRDMHLTFNWGYDKKTQNLYAHDLHIVTHHGDSLYYYKKVLDLAKQMGIK